MQGGRLGHGHHDALWELLHRGKRAARWAVCWVEPVHIGLRIGNASTPGASEKQYAGDVF